MAKLLRTTLAKRKAELNALIKKYGNAKRAAKALGVSSATIYERMKRYGIARKVKLLPGEPHDGKKEWLEGLIKKHGNAHRVSKILGISAQAVYERMDTYEIPRYDHLFPDEPQNFKAKKKWLKGLLEKYGTPEGVGAFLDLHSNSVRSRMKSYGIPPYNKARKTAKVYTAAPSRKPKRVRTTRRRVAA